MDNGEIYPLVYGKRQEPKLIDGDEIRVRITELPRPKRGERR